MRLLLFSAKRYSGKSEASKIVCQLARFRPYSFADHLRKSYSEAHGVPLEWLYRYKEEWRPEIIAFSWKLKAEHGEDYFFRTLIKQAEEEEAENVMIDDQRFYNAEFLPSRARGSKVYRLECSLETRIARGLVPNAKIDNDPSEIEMDSHINEMDGVMSNDGPREQLILQVKNLLYLNFRDLLY
jgi:phosphomevalonate kinase